MKEKFESMTPDEINEKFQEEFNKELKEKGIVYGYELNDILNRALSVEDETEYWIDPNKQKAIEEMNTEESIVKTLLDELDYSKISVSDINYLSELFMNISGAIMSIMTENNME